MMKQNETWDLLGVCWFTLTTGKRLLLAMLCISVTVAALTMPALAEPAVLFDGSVALIPGETFNVTAYNSDTTYTVNRTTPLGALDKASTTGGFTYDVTDKNYATSGALLLDNIGTYLYQKTPRKAWYAYVNDVYKDGYNNPAGALNLIELVDGDTFEFYYVDGVVADPTNLTAVIAAASAAVTTVASTGVTPTDWSLVLDGAKTETVTKTYFEQGLATIEANAGVRIYAVSEFRDGAVKVFVRPEDILLSERSSEGSSARNVLRGRIVELQNMGALTRVRLDSRLVALITTQSREELGLHRGKEVYATFKATAVHVVRE